VAGAAPAALLATRRLIDAAPTHSFDEHLDAEEVTIKGLLTTANVAEGVAAFVERRRPKFTGA
jgi:enoyl-CoA hydratase/carnithine racemase